MITTSSDTWGISGPTFLTYYLAVGGLLALAVLLYRKRPVAVGAGHLDVYDLAMLNGGADLAITSAAVKLRQAGLLRTGDRGRTLTAGDRGRMLTAGDRGGSLNDPIERAVFEAVERTPNISSRTLRRRLGRDQAITAKQGGLSASGLMLEPATARRLWAVRSLAGSGLVGLGIARIVAGSANHRPVGFLVVSVVAAAIGAAVWVGTRRPAATARGRAALAAYRRDRKGLKTTAAGPAEIPLAVALFGAGALWVGDPEFAHAWGVPRDAGGYAGGGGGCGGGGCGGGCGG